MNKIQNVKAYRVGDDLIAAMNPSEALVYYKKDVDSYDEIDINDVEEVSMDTMVRMIDEDPPFSVSISEMLKEVDEIPYYIGGDEWEMVEWMELNITMGKKYFPAMELLIQAEAGAYFERCVEHCMRFGHSREEAEDIERSNLAYVAAYNDEETRLRVEKLFKCVHPILGAAQATEKAVE